VQADEILSYINFEDMNYQYFKIFRKLEKIREQVVMLNFTQKVTKYR